MIRPRVLYVAHGHPSRCRGGTESCAELLYDAVRTGGEWDPWFVAGTADAPHAGTSWGAVANDAQQILFAGGAYDRFRGRLFDRGRVTGDWGSLLRLVRPDVVHFHHLNGLGFDFVRQVRNELPSARIVYTLHDYEPICAAHGQMLRIPSRERCQRADPQRCHGCVPDRSPAQHFLRERWIRSMLEHVDCFVAPSRFLRDRYLDWGLPADQVVVLENARPRSAAVDPRPPFPDQPPRRFGYFGQLSEVKGVLFLLRAAQLLQSRGVDVEVAIHGSNLVLQDARFQEVFRRELAACPRTVALHPPYPAADVGRLMRSVDWIVVPSEWWENAPLVVQEAAVHGRPVICSDIGGMIEKVRHGIDGMCFTAGDVGALATTMATAAATSRETWRRMSAAAQLPPTPEQSAADHLAIYRDLLRRHERAARTAERA